jgi:hypothetical protein
MYYSHTLLTPFTRIEYLDRPGWGAEARNAKLFRDQFLKDQLGRVVHRQSHCLSEEKRQWRDVGRV